MCVVAVDLVLRSLANERVDTCGVVPFAHGDIAIRISCALADRLCACPDELPGVQIESASALVQQQMILGRDGQDVEGHGSLGGGWGGTFDNVTGLGYTEEDRGEGHGQRNGSGKHGKQAGMQESREEGEVLHSLVSQLGLE